MVALKLTICCTIFYVHAVNSAIVNDENSIQSNSRSGSGPSARYHLSLHSVGANEAYHRCESNGGKLATIKTKEDVKALKYFLRRELDGYVFWMGGQLFDTEDCNDKPFNSSCWYWYDDSEKEDVPYDSTLIQFTDEAQYEKPVRFSFITILSGRKLKLDHRTGEEEHPFICDFQPSTKLNSRYYLAKNSVRAFDARDRCEFLGGKLATIKTKEDVKELQEVLSRETDVFWLGGRFSDERGCRRNPILPTCWYWDVEQADHDSYHSTVIQFSDEAFSDLRLVNPTSFITIIPGQNIKLGFDIESEYHPFICDLKSYT